MQSDAVRELVAAIERDASRVHGIAYDLHASDVQVSSDLFAIVKHLRHLVATVIAEDKHEYEPADINGKLLCFMCRQPADAPIHQKAGK